jgi:hypothetical protein
MHPHEIEHVDVHIQLPKAVYDEIKKLHPGYGGVSEIIRRLCAEYVLSRMSQN